MTLKYIIGFAFTLLFIQCSPKVGAGLTKEETTTIAAPIVDQSWRSNIPTPAEARKIELGTYNVFDLDNGLKVIVVENHKLPKVSYQVSLNTLPTLEGDKTGYVSLAGSLLSRGTSTKSKAEIDSSVDQIGASLGSSASGIYGGSLTKHQHTLLELMSDVLLNPSFTEEEFSKVKTQVLSGLQSDKDDPNSIAGKVASKVNYGANHPYAEVETEETINRVELKDCKEYYKNHFKPNNAYLTIVGDITLDEARQNAEKYFGGWNKGDVPNYEYGVPTAPSQPSVAFSNKESAVQSVIKVTYPVEMKPGSTDALHASVMNAILGGGMFLGRLMQNLREDKAFTYGARSSISPDRLVAEFSAGASVRNEVTDSSIVEFIHEMNTIVDEPISAKDLQLAKNSLAGSFARSLESSSTLARYAKNIVQYNLAEDYYETYLQRLEAVTIADVQNIAKKYIKPQNANIVVVGNKDEIVDKLLRFDGDGVIDYYDAYGNKLDIKDTELPSDITAETIIQKYIDRKGGSENLKKIKTFEEHYQVNTQGMTLNIDIHKAPNKASLQMGMSGMVMESMKFDGQKAASKGMSGSKTYTEGAQFNHFKEMTSIFPNLDYLDGKHKLELKGVDDINGESCYKIIINSPDEIKKTNYYSVQSGLLVREISTTFGPDGQPQLMTNDFSNYKEQSGITYATEVTTSLPGIPTMKMISKEVKFNGEISADKFLIQE